MDRQEWMYRTSRVDPSYLVQVRKFVAAAKKHRLSLKRQRIICPCNRCKNTRAQEDGVVLSHLVRFGFVKDYTVWRFHGEADMSAGASGGNSSASTTAMRNMIMGSIQGAFPSSDRKMVELTSQAGMLQGEAAVQGQMVLLSEGLPRYPVDNIVKRVPCTLVVPYGRRTSKKEVARGVAMPHESGSIYKNKPIPPDYARVDVTWTNSVFGDHEIDIPTPEGIRYLQGVIGSEVLWHKSDIILDKQTLSQPSPSPTGDDNDYDGDDNDNAGPRRSPLGSPLGTSNPYGGIGAATGNVTPPSSGPKEGKGQCPPTPRKPKKKRGP